MLRRGADAFTVQNIMGHSTMQMTPHYVNLTSEDTRRGHAAADVLRSVLGENETPKKKTIENMKSLRCAPNQECHCYEYGKHASSELN